MAKKKSVKTSPKNAEALKAAVKQDEAVKEAPPIGEQAYKAWLQERNSVVIRARGPVKQ